MYTQTTSNNNDDFQRYQSKITNFGQEFDLGLFIIVLRKNLIWILLFFVLASLAGFYYWRYTPRLYEASVILQTTTQNPAQRVLNVENLYEQDIAGEIELLRSKAFFKRALSRLNLTESYFAKGKFLNYEQYTASPYTVKVRDINPAIYGIPIFISFPGKKRIYTSYTLNDIEHKHPFNVGQWTRLAHANVKVAIHDFQQITSQQNQFKQNPLFFIINNPDNILSQYYPKLDVKILNQAAHTIQVSFKGNNTKKVADVVNAIGEEFINYDVEKKAESGNKVLTFIEEQLKGVYEQLRSSENKIQAYKKEYKLTESKDFITLYIGRLEEIENEIVNLELEENVYKEVQNTIEGDDEIDLYNLLPAITGAQDQKEISNLINSLQDLLSQKEKALYVATPESPGVKAINYRIGIQKKLLLESIRSLGKKILIRKKDLAEKAEEIENKFFNLPSQELEFARLLREFSINDKFYTMLLEKKAEYSISKAGFVSKNLILERAATSSFPVSPDKRMICSLCFIVWILFSLGLLAIRYLLHNNITSVKDITNYTDASLLGVIPAYSKDIPVSQLLVDKNPKSLIAESFRSVRTNLQFVSNKPGPKVIAITSTVSGEGKTFVSINLAGIIAFSDKKVIILDMDLRKPKIHLGFNVDNIKGISTILIGKDAPEKCIHNSSIKNLSFITAGPVPPNPSELIISDKMDELLDYLKTIYDVIVIDNPPLGIVTDGMTCIQKADYPIYIFRADVSKKHFVQYVNQLHNESHIKNISVVLNGVGSKNTHGFGYKTGIMGYGYGYTYGYGYYNEESEFEKSSFLKRLFKKVKA